ncbi:tachykinin-like peptides receptor 86C [Leguminivora glycinivorella]|uniref:tachykinin-like peptides receptor 86C n=1 Tax=Leguminivora glycinivorella TaxID=1035111 RepID=UPI00200E54D4|nr:tachykinin-like peptides receptor 86C [Leguminivora glycinivorella]
MVNDLETVVKNAKCLLYADDLKLIFGVKNGADCISLQEDIDSVMRWSVENKLLFNVAKCCMAPPWDLEPLPLGLQWFFYTLFIIIVPPAIVLNFMVICIVLCGRNMRKAANYPILSLALADLLTSICNTPWNFYYLLHYNWHWLEDVWWNGLFCKVNQFLSNTFIAASVFTLLAISVDR